MAMNQEIALNAFEVGDAYNDSSFDRTIIDRLRLHARTSPNQVAYTFLRDDIENESITFEQLERRTRFLAARLLKHAKPGDRALLLYPSGLEFITAFISCLYAGIITVPATTPRKNRSAHRLQAILEDASPTLVLTTTDIAPKVYSAFPPASTSFKCIKTDTIETRASDVDDLPLLHPDAVAFLQYTSGSTGTPKGVIVTHRNLVNNTSSLQEGLMLSHKSVIVSWLPLFHDMGLIGNTLTPLHTGSGCIFMSPASFLEKPLRWLQAITKYKATWAGAPNFGWDYCAKVITQEEKQTLDLGSLMIAYNGSEPVRESTLQNFYQAFAACGFRQEAWFPCYGMAEATLFVSGGPSGQLPNALSLNSAALERHSVVAASSGDTDSCKIVGCGATWLDTEVRIVNPDTQASVAADEVGEIWVAGGSVAKGYWQRPVETDEAFNAYIADTGEGPFLRTGDLGFIRDKEVFITGRLKDLIIIRGRNIYPQDVERTIERVVNFVKPNACAAFSIDMNNQEGLAVVVEADRALVRTAQRLKKERDSLNGHASNGKNGGEGKVIETLIADMRQAVAEEFDIPLHTVAFVMPGSFPRTTSGKVQRSTCRSKMLKGELDEVYSSNGAQPARSISAEPEPSAQGDDRRALIHDTVVKLLRADMKLAIEQIGYDTPLTSLGLDSVGMVALALELEEKTGKELSGDILYEYQTINELAAYISGKAKAATRQNSSSHKRAVEPAEARATNHAFAAQPRACQSTRDAVAVETSCSATVIDDRYEEATRRFDRWQRAGKYFFHTSFSELSDAWVVTEGKQMLMLGSYSYLGLLRHPLLMEASYQAMMEFGTGAHGARILAGTTMRHNELEKKIASLMDADDAIVYSSGFVTNFATIAALVREGDYVIGDEWNHASIVDGCKFSGATFLTFKHNDLASLENSLIQAEDRHKLVVVDAVYSMEGDIADMPGIVALCKRYGAMLMVDEAHSLGVLGENGRGIQEHFRLRRDDIDLKMGTISKALASSGGFIAGSKKMINFLRHNARGYMFSSALPAPQVAAASAAIDILEQEPERVEHLRHITNLYLEGLKALGFNTLGSETPIVPIACGSEETALEMTALCRDAGLYVVPVFYPAVPMNSSRLRTCVTAAHTEEDVRFALEVLEHAGRKIGLIA